MKRTWIAYICLLFVACVWGSTFIIVQKAVQTLPPLAFNAFRFLGATLLFAVVMGLTRRHSKYNWTGNLWKHGIVLGIWLFGAYALQTIGLLHTTTTNTGFITGISVVLVPFAMLWLMRQRMSWTTWVAAVMAFIGLYFLTFNGGALSLNKGDVLVFLCAICFAMQIALTGKYSPQYDTLPLVTIQLGTVGVLSFVSSLLTESAGTPSELWTSITNPDVLLALAVSVGLSTAFAFWAQTWSQRYTSASRVAIIYATEPVFAAITGLTFAGEELGIWAVVGCALIFGGMIFAEMKWTPKAQQSHMS
ncbi:EamA family transporter [Paenibacillus selenitireducens]|uniref:EamA family transporter n=1 Tax=Paenibacillus selenitireducens TaxID=1324314 RepID=A0A1T2X6K7_9BACL|nr:DMT family transporter [Paenibacillus selenitireducens]OPA75514.1 EamA family transporter [Paenibacillus selenitireducens]